MLPQPSKFWCLAVYIQIQIQISSAWSVDKGPTIYELRLNYSPGGYQIWAWSGLSSPLPPFITHLAARCLFGWVLFELSRSRDFQELSLVDWVTWSTRQLITMWSVAMGHQVPLWLSIIWTELRVTWLSRPLTTMLSVGMGWFWTELGVMTSVSPGQHMYSWYGQLCKLLNY